MSATDFEINRDRLTIFVVGPGFGESILVALPNTESWLIIDGAGPKDVLPAKQLLARHWKDESRIALLLLTHPHADHYAGISEILDDPKLGERIEKIGCVCEYLSGEPTLAAELRAAFELVDIDDPEAQTELGRARAVLSRIADEWTKRPERRFRAAAGETLTIGPTTVSLLSPTREEAAAFFRADDLPARIRDHANDLSVVVRLQFGATSVLLGGDLPDTRRGVTIASGWSSVARRHDDLDLHATYKVAHHASAEAIHDAVIRSDRRGRARLWLATPYNKGERLPDFTDVGGVQRLHEHEPSGIALTGLPVGVRQQTPMPETIARSKLVPDTLRIPALGGIAVTRSGRPPVSATDCIWAFELDASGAEVARHRGRAATIVVPG